jgi:LacI family transcriptional regulator
MAPVGILKRMARLRRIPRVLLLIETSRAYGRGLVEGIMHYAEENGPWSIYFEERGLTDPLPRWLKQWRGDGIISRTPHKADLARLLATGLPVVQMWPDLPLVYPDDEGIARLAVEHFLDRGLRQFAFFCTDRAHWIDVRRRAFEQTVQQCEYRCDSFRFAPARSSAGKKARQIDDRSVIRWLRKLPKPCGVLCATDFYAMRLVSACRTAGIIVPEQVAVLGVDNDPVFCGVCFPRLSSIDLGSDRIGYEAAALLDRMMGGKRPPQKGVCVEPRQVVTRESTDVLAVDDAGMAQAVRLIREQACRPLRVGQVAAAVGLSRRVFEQRFRRALHRSPKEEMLRVRIERAKMLLSTSDLAVSLVARKSGFSSPEYFARAFRRQTGTTPRTYRRQRRRHGESHHRQ